MADRLEIIGPYAVLDTCRFPDELFAAGKYGYIDLNIRGRGCQCGKCKPYVLERLYSPHIVLWNFHADVNSREAVEAMKAEGYRPANLRELLLLAKDYPVLQEKLTIVALGHVHYDHYYKATVAALCMTHTDPSKRMLREYFLERECSLEKTWLEKDGKFAFAAVKIPQGESPREYLTGCADWWGYEAA